MNLSKALKQQEVSQQELGRRRVLVLGDSVVNGGVQIGQDETATALATAADHEGREWAQAAAGGWGTPNELGWLQRYGERVEAERVVLVISTHDLSEYYRFGHLSGRTHPTAAPMCAVSDLVFTYGARFLPSDDPTVHDGPRCLAALSGIADWCRAKGLPLSIVVHAARDEAVPADAIAACRRLGIEPTVDFADADKAGGYVDGIHLSKAGQRHLADVLIGLNRR